MRDIAELPQTSHLGKPALCAFSTGVLRTISSFTDSEEKSSLGMWLYSQQRLIAGKGHKIRSGKEKVCEAKPQGGQEQSPKFSLRRVAQVY